MRDSTHAFFQKQGIFDYFSAFKTEILHIYSQIWQILKLSRLGKYPPLHLHFGG